MAIKNVVRLSALPAGHFLQLTYAAFDEVADDPVGAPDGSMWFNTTDQAFKAMINGAKMTFASASSATPVIDARLATIAALPAGTYANGTLGDGATFTVTATGVLTVDGQTVALNDYVLVKDQVSGLQNGIYKCTTAGALGVSAVLTRAPEFNIAATMRDGLLVTIGEGTLAGTIWVHTTDPSITVGTTAITFARETGVALLGTVQTFTAAHTFAEDKFLQANNAGTFTTKLRSLATAARTATLPDADFTAAQAAIATAAGGTGATSSTAPGVSDPNHDHGAATGAGGTGAVTGASASDGAVATSSVVATNVAEERSGFVFYPDVDLAAIDALFVATPMANGALALTAQPDFPRALKVGIVDADSSVSAGKVTFIGVGASGEALTEEVTLTGGTANKNTVNAYATVTSATVTELAGAGGADTVSIGTGDALGVNGTKVPSSSGYAVTKLTVDGVQEAAAAVDAAKGWVLPTTTPNGARDYGIWYTYTCTPTQNTHQHTGGAHTHAAGTLAGPSHTHTVAAGATGLTVNGHTHTGPSHTHTQS